MLVSLLIMRFYHSACKLIHSQTNSLASPEDLLEVPGSSEGCLLRRQLGMTLHTWVGALALLGLGPGPHCTHPESLPLLDQYPFFLGFPGGASGKEPACQCRRHKTHRLDPWIGKIPWRKAQQPTPGFLPGKSHGQRSPVSYSSQGCKEVDMTEVT